MENKKKSRLDLSLVAAFVDLLFSCSLFSFSLCKPMSSGSMTDPITFMQRGISMKTRRKAIILYKEKIEGNDNEEMQAMV